MAKKMTEGRPLPLIMGFAVPLLIGNVLQQTYNIIDAAIVGRALGANALASVGASSSPVFGARLLHWSGVWLWRADRQKLRCGRYGTDEKPYFSFHVPDRCICGDPDGSLCAALSADPASFVNAG